MNHVRVSEKVICHSKYAKGQLMTVRRIRKNGDVETGWRTADGGAGFGCFDPGDLAPTCGSLQVTNGFPGKRCELVQGHAGLHKATTDEGHTYRFGEPS